MGSVPEGDETVPDYPFERIVLDTTLHELLSQETDGPHKESLYNGKPNADPKHKSIPTNYKYLITSARLSDSSDLAHLQLENTSYLLSFWAGAMEVNLVGSEGWSDDPTLNGEAVDRKGKAAFSVINEKQRPKVRTFFNADDMVRHYGKGKTDGYVRWGFAVDFAENISSFIHPELHYKLNAKRWLAECRLRSANDQIIDVQCNCRKHRTKADLWYYDQNCTDCAYAMKNEIERVQKRLAEREPPYVFKLTQCLGSAGTTLVKTNEDRSNLVEYVKNLMEETLPRVGQDNAHIRPTSFVVSDFIPGNTMALNFYIKRDGSPVSLGICHQLGTRSGEGGRQNTALTWDHQEELEAKYKDSLREIGQVLHDEGYFGPAGADIMEDESGTQYVIDLNVRTATSLILGILRGHCEKRNFGACMVYECLLLGKSRKALYEELEKEFSEGRIILMGATRLGKKNIWAYPVVLCGEDQERLKALGEKVLSFESGKATEDAKDAGGG